MYSHHRLAAAKLAFVVVYLVVAFTVLQLPGLQAQALSHGRAVAPRRSLTALAAKPHRRKGGERQQRKKPSVATANPCADDVLAGVQECHEHEQFFWDQASVARLSRAAEKYEKPCFLCCPSLAHAAERAGRDHVLLDRDARFKFLRSYRRFELAEPYILPKKAAGYDCIFVDPPFANVTPKQVVKALQLMAPEPAQRAVPVYFIFPEDRGAELLEAFEGTDFPQLEKKADHLRYRQTVSEETQSRIHLFGPVGISC